MTKLLLVIGVARRGGAKPSTSIEMPPTLKIITTKRYFFSVSVSSSIFAYNSIHVQQTNINNQVGGLGPSNQIFAVQFKCITRIQNKTKVSLAK